MVDPLISVVVPTYNRAYCISRAIDSVLAQSYSNLEVLVIDDGSSDDTAEVIRSRYAADPRLRYHWKANGGAGSARNEGMARAAGEFIAFLDSDDQWKPWKLALQVQCASRFPELGLLWTDMDAVGSDGRLVKSRYISDYYRCYKHLKLRQIFSSSVSLDEILGKRQPEMAQESFHWGDVFAAMFMGNIIHTSTALLRREMALRVHGGFNPSFGQWGEDYDFYLRCTTRTLAGYVTAPTILYQIGTDDRATQSKFSARCARNCLISIGHILTTRRGMKIPRETVRTRMANVHAWLTGALLDEGDYAAARAQFRKSLSHRLWQPRNWKLFLLTCLPSGLGEGCRRLYRSLKGAISGLGRGSGRRRLAVEEGR